MNRRCIMNKRKVPQKATDEEKQAAALAVVRKIRDCTVYVVPPLVMARCRGCRRTKELRQGFCYECLEPYMEDAQRIAHEELTKGQT